MLKMSHCKIFPSSMLKFVIWKLGKEKKFTVIIQFKSSNEDYTHFLTQYCIGIYTKGILE